MAANSTAYKSLSQAAFLVYADMIGAQAGAVSPNYTNDEAALSSGISAMSGLTETASPSLTTALNQALSSFRTALQGDGQVLLELESGQYAMAANDAVNTGRLVQGGMTTINTALSASGVTPDQLQPVPSAYPQGSCG
jgi:hypothetical protein